MTESAKPSPDRADVLVVLGHPSLVRNFAAEGCLRALVDRGLRVAVVAPDDTLPLIAELAPGLMALKPLSAVESTARRRRALNLARVGSMVGREHSRHEYALRVGWTRKGRLEQRVAVAFWRTLARFGDPERMARAWSERLAPRPSARELIRELNPRLVLWPTTIANSVDFDIVSAARRAGIPVVMCEGSFDNLVAKGAIWPRPQRLLVWGEFSRAYAREQHGFSDEEVVITGAPHFGVYERIEALTDRREWRAAHGLDPEKRVILVAGSTVGVKGETGLLRTLSRWIDEQRIPPASIWYRPHPRSAFRIDLDALASIPHVRVDPGVNPSQPRNWIGLIDRRDARQRADVIAACDAIVSVFSTVVLEGALLGKPSALIDVPSLEGASNGLRRSFQEFGHLRHLRACPWIKLAPDLDALAPILREFLELEPASIREPLRAFAQGLAFSDGTGAPPDRICRVVEECLQAEGR